MKITCSKNNLVVAVNIVSRAVPAKTTMNILECILIEASNGIIKLTSNNTEMGIETKVAGQIEENGVVAIDAKIFGDIVRRLPESDIHIETDPETLMTTIKADRAKFNLRGKSGDDFTPLPKLDKSDYISISQFTLKEIIRQTIFSITDNENNKIMSGELFEINGENLRVSALDGHRIAIRNIELRQNYDSHKVIIPGKTLGEISKILTGEVEKTVNIFFMDRSVTFEFDKTIVVSRLIEGEYFNIDQMLMHSYGTSINVNRKRLLDSIDRATLLIKEGDKKPVIINITDDEMQLKINSTIGSMDERLEIKKSGDDLLIGFNPKFIIEALRSIDDDEVSLYFTSPKSPCFIRDDSDRYIYLILPINFNNVR